MIEDRQDSWPLHLPLPEGGRIQWGSGRPDRSRFIIRPTTRLHVRSFPSLRMLIPVLRSASSLYPHAAQVKTAWFSRLRPPALPQDARSVKTGVLQRRYNRCRNTGCSQPAMPVTIRRMAIRGREFRTGNRSVRIAVTRHEGQMPFNSRGKRVGGFRLRLKSRQRYPDFRSRGGRAAWRNRILPNFEFAA